MGAQKCVGQLRLKTAKVLIVGVGGLGCPAAAYIAGAGVGTIGMVDGDEVEISNLHRQVLHSTEKVKWKKVDSSIHFLKSYIFNFSPSFFSLYPTQIEVLRFFRLNPNPAYIPHRTHLTPENAEEIVKNYDVVLDCTDNPASRYLISDISVLLHKPLISASALRTDGQLVILNSPALAPGEAGGPCYRCVFPKPPPAASVVSCGEGGILGPVVGVMGVLQALNTIKLIVNVDLEQGSKTGDGEAYMLLFSADSPQPFRSVKLRGRRKGCFACSTESQLSLESLASGSLDYALFCGLAAPINILASEERISVTEYQHLRSSSGEHVLLDVREKVQFDICHLEGSVNIPFSAFQVGKDISWMPADVKENVPIYVICRLGNDSQIVTRKLKDLERGKRHFGDIKGGFKAWREQVDTSWPDY
jgi:adenylyltransferase/sulfurtransferase